MEGIRQALHGRDHVVRGGAHLVDAGPSALADEVITGIDNTRSALAAFHVVGNGLVGDAPVGQVCIGDGARHDNAVLHHHLVDLSGLHQQFYFSHSFSFYHYASHASCRAGWQPAAAALSFKLGGFGNPAYGFLSLGGFGNQPYGSRREAWRNPTWSSSLPVGLETKPTAGLSYKLGGFGNPPYGF
jgi:hypothetical protein